MEYFSKELKDPVVVNKILMGLKIPANCGNVRVPMLHKAAAKNLYHIIKELIRDYQMLQHQQSLK